MARGFCRVENGLLVEIKVLEHVAPGLPIADDCIDGLVAIVPGCLRFGVLLGDGLKRVEGPLLRPRAPGVDRANSQDSQNYVNDNACPIHPTSTLS